MKKTICCFAIFIALGTACKKRDAINLNHGEINYFTEVGFQNLSSDTLYTVFIPDAFSPNFDGINDGFTVTTTGIISEGYLFQITDEANHLIFKSTEVNAQWNGRLNNNGNVLPQKSYFYKAICYDMYKTKHTYEGQVMLIL